MQEIIRIAGREFKGAKNSTMEHDVYVQGMIAKADLDRIEMLVGETSDEFAMRIFRKTVINADVFLLLGGLLFPVELEPAKWTPKVAEETADFLRHLTAPEDKKIVQGQIVGAIMGFFQKGLIYSVYSRRSSEKDQPSRESQTEDMTNMESGAKLSELLPNMT